MNNTFDFKRFKQVLSYDWHRFVRNFGITLLVWISIPIMFWVTSLVFDFDLDNGIRVFIIFGLVAITVMSAPSRIYGKINLPREGVSFAMLPASGLEQFLSMFLYCSIVTPALTLVGSWLVDCLMTLLPFGGFTEFIPLEVPTGYVSEFFLALLFLVAVALAESSIFMFGNMVFKRRKSGKTFGWILLVLFVITLFFQLTNAWVLLDKIFITGENVTNMWIFIGVTLAVAVGFYYGSYRKIKTQKY